MFILQAFEIIGRTFLAVFEALLSLFPVYQELSGLQDQIIAAAIGVPVVVISVGGILFAIGKFIWRHV